MRHVRKFLKKIAKVVGSAAVGVCAAVCVAGGSISASACCDVLYFNNETSYLYSDKGWTEDTKICQIPEGSIINVTDICDGWGRTEYTDKNTGMTAIGWTYLSHYVPLMLDQTNTIVSVPKEADTLDKQIVWTYLVSELGMNAASASGVMANIQAESGFNPQAHTIDTNGLDSYGLCQWNGSRFDQLRDFCEHRDLSYQSADSQMKYLQYELEGSYRKQGETMKQFPNTAEGAYDAAYYWASKFEVCLSDYWTGRAVNAYAYYNSNF